MLQRYHVTESACKDGFELLPAIDLRGGRVVRLMRGDFGMERAYSDDPLAVAREYLASGARWLHVVDLDGARDGASRQMDVVEAILAGVGESACCQVAGGLRDMATVEAVLALGATRVVIGTAALAEPGFAAALVAAHGPSRIVAALDVRDGQALGRAWVPGEPGRPVEDALAALARAGIETFAVTAIERDGTLTGPDLALLDRIVRLDRGRVIASGGIGTLDDLRRVRDLGCAGAIVGRALYEGRFTLTDALSVADADDLSR